MDRTANFYSQPTYARGGALPIYSGSRRQRGGNVLGAIKSFFMPILDNAKRRGISSGIQLAKNVAWDAFTGKPIKQSLKTRGIEQAKQFGINVAKDTFHHMIDRRKTAKRNAAVRKRARSNKAKQRSKRVKTNF